MTNNQMLTFTPASPLAGNTIYTVQVSGFTDASGNAVVSSNTAFTTTGTTTTGGLSITSTNIGNGATNVSSTSPIILTFNHVLNPATVNSGTIDVFDGWSGFHPLAGSLTVNGNQITFTPANPYPALANIAVGSCNGPTDVLGNVYSGCWNEILNFTVVGARRLLRPSRCFRPVRQAPMWDVTRRSRSPSAIRSILVPWAATTCNSMPARAYKPRAPILFRRTAAPSPSTRVH